MREHHSPLFLILLTTVLLMACETLAPESDFYLRVYNENGNPVQSAEIRILSGPFLLYLARTDGYGRATISSSSFPFPLKIELHHPTYLSATTIIDSPRETVFLTLKTRAQLIRKSYHLAEQGYFQEALQILNREPGFSATNLKEQYYLALLYYLNNTFEKSRELLKNIPEPIPAVQNLLGLMNDSKKKGGSP